MVTFAVESVLTYALLCYSISQFTGSLSSIWTGGKSIRTFFTLEIGIVEIISVLTSTVWSRIFEIHASLAVCAFSSCWTSIAVGSTLNTPICIFVFSVPIQTVTILRNVFPIYSFTLRPGVFPNTQSEFLMTLKAINIGRIFVKSI